MFEFGDVKLQTEMFILLLWVGSRYHLDLTEFFLFLNNYCIVITIDILLSCHCHVLLHSLDILLITRCNRMIVSHVSHCCAVNLPT